MPIFVMMMTFADFILRHGEDDPVRLLLSRDRYPDVDMDLAVTTLEVRRKLRTKVPEWYAVPSLVYPSRLSGEQCSSSGTARYKASLIARFIGEGVPPETCGHSRQNHPKNQQIFGDPGSQPFEGPAACGRRGRSVAEAVSGGAPSPITIADLTGGMGVDAWAFAEVFGEVLYNEMQEELVKAAELNFRELGVENVVFRNRCAEPGKVKEVLDGFEPDVIYLDPARRAEDGRKVFLIEDCRPDVLKLLPELFEASRFVLLKLSPMADITMACKRLERVREVHVVASEGECKELLFLLDREWSGEHAVFVCEGGAVMEIPGQAGNDGEWQTGNDGEGQNRDGEGLAGEKYLFEPGKALMKAGAFSLPCDRFGMGKLAAHTHLYTCETIPEGLAPFGKWFEILEVLPLNNRTMKEAGKRYPRAEVTARNIPMTSDLLRKKTGCPSGGDIHLFGVRADFPSGSGNYLIISKRIAYGND